MVLLLTVSKLPFILLEFNLIICIQPSQYIGIVSWIIILTLGVHIYRKLLRYLDEKDVQATFFVVGSRVVERPVVLTEEYMSGHEISVHTWSHHVSSTTVKKRCDSYSLLIASYLPYK